MTPIANTENEIYSKVEKYIPKRANSEKDGGEGTKKKEKCCFISLSLCKNMTHT